MSGPILRDGQLDELVWERSVRKRLGSTYAGARSGIRGTMPAGRFEADRTQTVISMETAALPTPHVGALAVIRALNALAAKGAEAEFLQLRILLPAGTSEQRLRDITDEIGGTANGAGVPIADIRAEVTRAAALPSVIAQAAGHRHTAGLHTQAPAPGAEILALGMAGLGGTVLLASDRRRDLSGRFSVQFLRQAEQLRDYMLMTQAVRTLTHVLSETGVSSCHMVNASDGGIYAALRQLSGETGCGLEVSLPAIPIRQETIEIADFYDMNPYQLASDGCILAAVEPCGGGDPSAGAALSDGMPSGHRGKDLCRRLSAEGVQAELIGHLTAGRERLLINAQERQYLNRPAADALLTIPE